MAEASLTSPVQGEGVITPDLGATYWPGFRVPRIVAEIAYVGYSARYGHSQSLERLEERGGFGFLELAEHYAEGKKILEERRAKGWRGR